MLDSCEGRREEDSVQSLDQYHATQDRDDAFEQRLDDALATGPELTVPADFAARLAALVPARPMLQVSSTAYARRSVVISTAVLLAMLLLLAPHAASGTTLPTLIEWIVCAQLSLVGLLTISPWSPWRFRG